MITKKESLLVLPFQQKKYKEHRKKVEYALPKIDAGPPREMSHVTYKLKKLQSDSERCSKIEKDNLILLQHLSSITRSKRVDNQWLQKLPKLLTRIKIYPEKSSEKINTDEKVVPLTNEINSHLNRKQKCMACNKERYIRRDIIPEERIPFELKGKQSNKQYEYRIQTNDIKLTQKDVNQRKIQASKKDISKRHPLKAVIEFPISLSVNINAGMADLRRMKNNTTYLLDQVQEESLPWAR